MNLTDGTGMHESCPNLANLPFSAGLATAVLMPFQEIRAWAMGRVLTVLLAITRSSRIGMKLVDAPSNAARRDVPTTDNC